MKFLKSIIFVLLVLFSVLFLIQADLAKPKFAITGHEMKVYEADCLLAYKATLGDIGGEELFPKLYDIPSTVCKEQKMMDVRPTYMYMVRFKIENTEKNSKDGIMILYENREGVLYPFTYQPFKLTGDDPYCYLMFDPGYHRPEENVDIIIGVQIRNTDGKIAEEYLITLPVFAKRSV